MYLTALFNCLLWARKLFTTKTVKIMKLTAVFLLAACLQVSARGYTQTITIHKKDAPLQSVFHEIEKQSGYRFFYKASLGKEFKKVTISLNDATLTQAMNEVLQELPLTYEIINKTIVVNEKTAAPPLSDEGTIITIPPIDIHGKVVNEKGEPIAGATITVKGTRNATATDGNGEFILKNVDEKASIVITGVSIQTVEIKVSGRTDLSTIIVNEVVKPLEEIITKGYYNTSKRLNTGSVSKVSASDIGTQPVSNPLAALQGLVPGLQITQANGLPGSNFTVRIRGQNSIQSGNSPLYIIDGVPFLNDGDVLTQRSGINANSPFNTIDPSEIESIEILKDADATAIYGSRGANGVILITTKKGKSGKTSFDININNGWGRVTRTIKFMNTPQYLEMGREAFKNDGVTPDISNAYDFLVWDSTRYTNLEKLLIGNTALQTNISTNISGGNEYTKFLIGSNYYKETTVFPGNNADNRATINLNLTHKTKNNKFNIIFNASFANDNSNLIRADLTQYINLPPVIPALYDSLGKLSWSSGGFPINNPLAEVSRKYKVVTNRLTANFLIEYNLSSELKFRVSAGYNMVNVDERDKVPISSQNPQFSPYGSAFFGKNEMKSWIIEPQIEYNKALLKNGKLQAQIGGTLQEKLEDFSSISASGYSNDNLLNSTVGAQTITSQVSSQLYHYQAVFGRVNYNLAEKYIINLTGRRDGSSRFGPGKQFANFWAAGAAWIFSSEKYFKENLKFLSFGKIRGSYGITGNDLIGNYNYLDLYGQTNYPYQNQPSLFPTNLFNSDYSWEEIKKLDIAADLGFLQNRILITVDWFKNKSTNQIINYSLPSQTGFNYVLKNFPGVVQNSGIEFSLNTENIKGEKITWTTAFNITFEKNKLLKFPDLETSSYADRYIIGKPLNAFIGPEYSGVDPVTGVYQYLDKDKKPTFSPSTEDNVYFGTTDPKFYGGIQNNFSFKNFQLSLLFEFRKQMGIDPVFGTLNIAGMQSNQPVGVLNRWQKPGDHATYEQYTQTFSPAAISSFYIFNSSAKLTDASFCRLKNLSISYLFPNKWLEKERIEKCRLYIEGQNLFVITKYKGADPENQSLYQLPPLKRFVLGIQITL